MARGIWTATWWAIAPVVRKATAAVILVCLVRAALPIVTAQAQQIFRWTDEAGTIHFGVQPPPSAKGLEAETAPKSKAEMECEAAVRQECYSGQKSFEKHNPQLQRAGSQLVDACLRHGMVECEGKLDKVKTQPTQRPQRYLATATLHFDPVAGDSLRCEMRCHSNCRGPLEIRTDRVLKRGENYGTQNYSIEVKPDAEGSAFCSVSTNNDDVLLVLAVVRDGHALRTTEAQ